MTFTHKSSKQISRNLQINSRIEILHKLLRNLQENSHTKILQNIIFKNVIIITKDKNKNLHVGELIALIFATSTSLLPLSNNHWVVFACS
jgi:hypothetical protein